METAVDFMIRLILIISLIKGIIGDDDIFTAADFVCFLSGIIVIFTTTPVVIITGIIATGIIVIVNSTTEVMVIFTFFEVVHQ